MFEPCPSVKLLLQPHTTPCVLDVSSRTGIIELYEMCFRDFVNERGEDTRQCRVRIGSVCMKILLLQGVLKKRTFRIIIQQAYTLERSDLRCLESDLSGQNGEHCEI